MKFKKKLKKIKKITLITYIFLTIIYLISNIFVTVNILSLAGIENLIRYLFITLTFVIWILYFLLSFIWLFEKKKIRFIIFSILILIFSLINFVASYYVSKGYNILDSIRKNKTTYISNLVVLSENTIENSEDYSLGLIEDEDNICGNVLAKEIISDQNLNNVVIVYYSDYESLIKALYNKEVDGVFLPSNYAILFSGESSYSDIKNETEVLYEKSATEENDDEEITYSNSDLTQPFTILLLGIDSTADGLTENQAFNGDSIMLITFNPNTLSTTFLSIPRDTYVPISCRNGIEAKINSSAYYGTSCVIDTIEDFTGIDIDYYFKINFTGLVDLVDALGGIEVDVPYSLCEQNSQREWGNSTVYIESGLQTIDGEQALALSRNRHKAYDGTNTGYVMATYCPTYTDGVRNDFIRGQNQQLVVEGIINKLKSISNIDEFYKVLGIISNNMDTNMTTDTMLSSYNIGKSILQNYLSGNEALNIQRLYLQTYNLIVLNSSTEQYQEASLEAIVKAMKYNLEIEEPELTKTFSFDVNTPYEETVLGKGLFDSYPQKYATLPSFIGKTKEYASSWASNNSISINFVNVCEGDELYDSTYTSGTIVSQSMIATTLLNSISSLTFYVISN